MFDLDEVRELPAPVENARMRLAGETPAELDYAPDTIREAAHGSPVDATTIRRVRIVRATDGGQLRTVITGTKPVRTTAYPSRRFGCIRYGEATTECVRLPAEEICPVTVESLAQPMRIEALCGDRWIRTVVDVAAVRVDGVAALVECKRDWTLFRTRGAETQAVLAKVGARCLGMAYERYVLANAGGDRRRANVDEVQACRFVEVPGALAAGAAALLARGPASLLAVSRTLAPDWHLGRARAYALAALRMVDIDLDGTLGPATECRATPAPSSFLPTLRAA